MTNPLPRLPQWRARFSSYLIACASTPFEDGVHDCALFLASGVEAQTGVDFAAPFRGKYSTAKGAVRALKRYGAGDLASTIAAALPEIDPGDASHGDAVIFDQPNGLTCGFVLPSNIVSLSPNGLRYPSKDVVERAFKVGL